MLQKAAYYMYFQSENVNVLKVDASKSSPQSSHTLYGLQETNTYHAVSVGLAKLLA